MDSSCSETDAGDYIAAFARRHRLDEAELRECIALGPRFVRQYLEDCGVLDDFPKRPRPPAAARNQEQLR